MRNIKVKVYPSASKLKKKQQLAWKIAEIASDNAKLNEDAIDMVINRIIDNASVAIASFNRKPVVSAREMALAHPRKNGATLFGINSKKRFHCEWAAWANGTAVRELDFHDTFLAADYSHPGDNIPPILAVAQQKKISGKDLIKGINPRAEVSCEIKYADGSSKTIKLLSRIDTENEIEYYKNGGILQFVLRNMIN